jgi:hypothetical protein
MIRGCRLPPHPGNRRARSRVAARTVRTLIMGVRSSRLVRAAIALLAAVALAGAGAAPGSAATVPLCTAPAVSASFGGQGATQSLLGWVTVTNHARAACRLSGRPAIAMRGGSPHELLRERAIGTAVMWPGQRFSATIVLAPGRSASVLFQWFNWCNPKAEAPPTGTAAGGRRPSRVLVTLAPGSRALIASVPQLRTMYLPICGDPGAPSQISVSLWMAGR